MQYYATSIIKNIPAMFGLENLLDEKDIYPYHHRKMLGRHMSDIYLHLCTHYFPILCSCCLQIPDPCTGVCRGV